MGVGVMSSPGGSGAGAGVLQALMGGALSLELVRPLLFVGEKDKDDAAYQTALAAARLLLADVLNDVQLAAAGSRPASSSTAGINPQQQPQQQQKRRSFLSMFKLFRGSAGSSAEVRDDAEGKFDASWSGSRGRSPSLSSAGIAESVSASTYSSAPLPEPPAAPLTLIVDRALQALPWEAIFATEKGTLRSFALEPLIRRFVRHEDSLPSSVPGDKPPQVQGLNRFFAFYHCC
jgi:hypothetical protein